MVLFTPFGMEGGITGDRVDALVWAFYQLFPQIIGAKPKPQEKPQKKDWARDSDSEHMSWKTL
jgi:hypothetical protein